MILNFVLKYGKYIIDIAIIAIIIFLISLLNPFGLFGPNVKLQNTANLVSSIKDIGQIVTAEYFGEVITSYQEAKILIGEQDELNSSAADMYINIKYKLLELYQLDTLKRKEREEYTQKDVLLKHNVNKRNILSKIYSLDEINQGPELFNNVLHYIDQVALKNKVQSEIPENNKKEVLFLVYSQLKANHRNLGPEEFTAYLNSGFNLGLSYHDFYYNKKLLGLGKKDKKKELVMIGRGSVKAGFNFGTLDNRNFYYNKEQGIIHLYNIQPEILDADINPWFIPQNKIQGFQLVSYNGRVNFNDAKIVKERCVEKLKIQAQTAGILETAQRNGEETLVNFFSLLTGEDIKKVIFHASKYSHILMNISKDNKVSIEEALYLDTLIRAEMDSINLFISKTEPNESEQSIAEIRYSNLQKFIRDLYNIKYVDSAGPYYFNYYFFKISRIIKDYQIDKNEFNEILYMREPILDENNNFKILNKRVWFMDSLDFIPQYNDLISFLVPWEDSIYFREDTLISYPEDSILLKNTLENSRFKNYSNLEYQYDSIRVVRNAYNKESSFTDYKYDLKINYPDIFNLITQNNPPDVEQLEKLIIDTNLINNDSIKKLRKIEKEAFINYIIQKNKDYNTQPSYKRIRDYLTRLKLSGSPLINNN